MTQGFLNNTSCSSVINLAFDQAPTTWRPLDARPGLNVAAQACPGQLRQLVSHKAQCLFYLILSSLGKRGLIWVEGRAKGVKSLGATPNFSFSRYKPISDAPSPDRPVVRKISLKPLAKEGLSEVTLLKLGPGNTEAAAVRSRGAAGGRGLPLEARAALRSLTLAGRPLSRPAWPSPRVPPKEGPAHLPPVGTLRDEPGNQEADEAPEHAHHDERHREAAIRHGCRGTCQPLPSRLTLVPPGSVNTRPRDQRAHRPASRAPT